MFCIVPIFVLNIRKTSTKSKAMKLLSLAICLSFPCWGFAQQGPSVTGSVLDQTGKPMEKASVMLLKAKDSTQVKGTSTGTDGAYHLHEITPGSYLILASGVGMAKQYSAPFALTQDPVTVPAIRLSPDVKGLAEVTVTAKKPLVEQKIDRMVVNVDASPTNVGSTAMDVLQKTPGISVDKDGNISLKGKSGVMVMIDGKPTYLSSADLANLLKNMPASELETIEVMTNPPAKYDAAGNAGVINLKTKKNKARGFNGNVTIGGGEGKGPKTNNSFNLNYRTGNLNLFGSYNEAYNRNPQVLNLTRRFRDTIGGPISSIFVQQSNMVNDYSEQSFKVGADYSLSKKTTVGVVFNGFFNPGYFDDQSATNMEDGLGNIDSVSTTRGHTKQNFQNFGTNLNFKHTFDTTGIELTADLDYLGYGNSGNEMYYTGYTTPKGDLLPLTDTLRGNMPSHIHIYTGKVDYVNPFKHGWKLEAGVKASSVKTDNNAEYDNLDAGEWIVDTTKTNHFVYTETIYAAYGNLTKIFNKQWTVQAGLRLESTQSQGNLETTGQTFTRNYTQLFPTTYIQYALNDKNQFVLDFGRRIQRPDYSDLNPFIFFLDPYTYQEGNPYLKPQFSNNIELSHTYRGFLTTTLNYTQVTDIIQQILIQNDTTHTTFVQQGNVARQENIGLSVNAGFPLTKWWTTNLYVSGAYNDYKGIINGYPIEVFGYSVTGNMNNSFTFKHGWGAEMSGWYQGRQVSGTIIANPMGSLDFGGSKTLLKGSGTLRLSVRDPFNLAHFSGYSKYGNVDVNLTNHWDNRVVSLSFTYRFGKNQQLIREHRQSSSASEEASRVKKGS
jgi:iron complex outermembrane recepter protein